MEENFDINSILQWYLETGVDATCDEKPALRSVVEKDVRIKASQKPVVLFQTGVARPATTSLAQASIAACKNARELCEKAASLDELRQAVEAFEGCALKLTAKSTVFGAGDPHAHVMIIGEAPGADEDRIGQPFVGRSGHLLEKMLAAIGLKRDEVYITNVLPWRPPGNRTPTDGEVAVCLPFLRRQIEFIRPKVLLLLGGSAANALLDNGDPISRLRGHWLEYKSADKSVFPALASFHPAYLLRNSAQKAKAWSDFLRLLKKLKEN